MLLKKGISFWGVFSIASGAMISSGIFILPGLAFSKAGPAVFISYFIAGFLGLIGILSVIELSTAMPKAGGDYYFINKTFGPMFGTISGFLGWLALSLKSSFAIFGLSEIIYLYTGISPIISGLILCIFFVVINIRGVKEAAIFQTVMVIGLFSLMSVYIIIGLPNVKISHFTPLLTVEINEILITAGFIFISFGGLLKVANVSEEVINPKRNIPLGMISSVIVVTIFYTLITFVITGTLEPDIFMGSLTPVADSAKIIMGNPGYVIIIIASMLAFFTTANAGIMSASRYPVALSRDQLLPRQLGSVNMKYKTPTIATIITGAIIYLSLLLPLEMLVKSASTVILTSTAVQDKIAS
ncbi:MULTISPECIES: APC family permease [unclassified Oceanispirochaeta]|uniref:APC family permease n=1 Tax=unclassified Oceanispirochaeta TaxID=2635722 RepID=UPI000E09C366|nr:MULTISPECIES: APC family permease [unclassified Oceanispirochaeta]MBF9016822.1 amino acid permease [Oceanispirochaeta sp. M2]NPD73185.1 amino acid permease [Oceanispirochaeta sp. M1]RDG31053.1 amino acid permease [Oceanispirochaeta sp. M1]